MRLHRCLVLALVVTAGCKSAKDSSAGPAPKPVADVAAPVAAAPRVAAPPPGVASPGAPPTLTLGAGESLADNKWNAIVWSTSVGPLGLAAVVRDGTATIRAFDARGSRDVFSEPAGDVRIELAAQTDGTVVVRNVARVGRVEGAGTLWGVRVTRLAWDDAKGAPVVKTRTSCTEAHGGSCEEYLAEWTTQEVPGPTPIVTTAAVAPIEPASPDTDDRPPTPDEIERCARLLVITAACGLYDDAELGWQKSDVKTTTLAQARTACTVPALYTEGGRALPVKLLPDAKLGALEAAATRGCRALRHTLDRVDPRMGAAGDSGP